MTKPPVDLKESLSSGRKPDISHMRTPFLVYGSRACEYGSAKYQRANFLRRTGGGMADDFQRLRSYLSAVQRHVLEVLDRMEAHQAVDPLLLDDDGMKVVAFCCDNDFTPGAPVGPSKLPHLCGAVASLNMAIAQAVDCGLLPRDPGQPWAKEKK